MPEAAQLEAILAGIFGLLIGSFLNVCIHRWPQDLSVVAPRSRCPHCEAQIAWYDNIPVVSWILLRARCRHCKGDIHWRYPLVEMVTGVFFCLFVARFGLTPEALKYCVFSAILIGLLFSDLETLLLPDQFTVGGFLVGLAFAPFVAVPDSTFRLMAGLAGWTLGPRAGSFAEAVAGGILPAGVLWFAGWIFEKVRHKQGLGFGDVKMIAMIGAFLGFGGTLLTIILGCVAGSVIGLIYIKATHRDPGEYHLPLGSFLAAGALFTAVFGQRWYWALFG